MWHMEELGSTWDAPFSARIDLAKWAFLRNFPGYFLGHAVFDDEIHPQQKQPYPKNPKNRNRNRNRRTNTHTVTHLRQSTGTVVDEPRQSMIDPKSSHGRLPEHYPSAARTTYWPSECGPLSAVYQSIVSSATPLSLSICLSRPASIQHSQQSLLVL